MSAVEAEIDWTRASDDYGLIEACRAAASVAAQFESGRRREKARHASFGEIFRRLHAAARAAARS